MADLEMAKFIKQHRRRYGDDAVRAQLLKDGCSPGEIEAAFQLATTLERGPAGLTPKAQPAKSKRSWGSYILIGAGGLTLLFVVGVVGGLTLLRLVAKSPPPDSEAAAGSESPSGGGASGSKELDAFEPEAYAAASFVDEFLPEKRASGNAGQDYLVFWRALQSASGDGKKPDAAAQARALSSMTFAIERGVVKRENAIVGVLWTPETLRDSLSFAQFPPLLSTVGSQHFKTLAEKQEEDGDASGAEKSLRRLVALGYHMMQDWDATSQLVGGLVLTQGLLGLAKLKGAPVGSPERMRMAKALKQVLASMPRPEDLKKVRAGAGEPERLKELERYYSEDSLRRPYCLWALQNAMANLTDAELASGRLAEARRDFARGAAEHSDARVSALGKAALSLADDIERELREADPAERRKLLKEWKSISEHVIKTAGKAT